MKIVSEIIGLFIISLVMIAVPILCALSFAYNWFVGLKFILSIACFVEWICFMSLLSNMADKKE